MKYSQNILATTLTVTALHAASAQTIPVHELKNAPTLDGDGADWSEITAETISLSNTVEDSKVDVKTLNLKVGVHGDSVYFYATWKDTTEDRLHKPFVWGEEGKYQPGSQREDRLALQFHISGDYDTNWLSGKEFTADMWHWKASRSDPLNKADDKMTVIKNTKLLNAYKGETTEGTPVYIFRERDSGDKPYTTKRYRQKQEDIMPKYILNLPGQGSSMDVDAKGVWKNGQWTLELRRKLDTGHNDDVKFIRGTKVLGGIAIFDHSENDDHAISDVLTFDF